MTRDEMLLYVNNPNRSISYVLDKLELATNGDITVSDPTNPFVMLLECSAISAANSILEPISAIRKLYPDLAQTKEDLFQHISDNEVSKIHSTPAIGSFIFYINLLDFKNLAVNSNDNLYKEATIPSETKIEISNTTFTLLNDINIRLYPDDTVFVEQMMDTANDLSIDELGILNSGIITDKLGNKWIIFETLIKQISITSTTQPIVTADTFNFSLPLQDKYVSSNCEFINSYTNNEYMPFNKILSDTYYNPNIPSIMIAVLDTEVNYRIPDVYLINNIVSGTVRIRQYETKGKIYLPIDKYPSSEFKIVYPSKTITDAQAAIKNITVQIQSRLPVEGGDDGLTFEELQDSVIKNSKAYQNLPITRSDIENEASNYGFEIFKATDTITDRVYFGSKNLPSIESELILSDPDIYFNKASIVLGNTINNSNIILTEDYSIVKSGTVFKEVDNEIILVNDDELDYISKMTNIVKAEYFDKYKYFITPYYYIIKPDPNIANKTIVKAYNLDTPTLDKFKIIAKNNNINVRANTNSYEIVKKGDMFIIKTTIKSNDLFESLNPDSIKAQLTIPLEGGTNYVNFNTTYDKNENGFMFSIVSDLYINDNDCINILNGTSLLTDKMVNLLSEAKLYIYTTDSDVYDPTRYLVNNIVDEDNANITVLNLESIEINFGYELDYLWKNIYNGYTSRQYKTYDEDVYARYTEDIYEVLNEDGETVIVDEDGNVTYNLLHTKGSIIYDQYNEPVIEHKKGELILDENGLPIIDKYYGVVHYIDIVMIDYVYYLSNNSVYINYTKLLLETLNRWLTLDIKLINDKLLENTKMFYKSYLSTDNVKLILNNKTYINKYYTRPEVTIYTNLTKLSLPIEVVRKTIGNIIRKHLLMIEFNVDEVRKEIMETYPTEIVGCSISNITDSGIDRFKIKDLTRRLTIDKKLSVSSGNELLVEYNIDIKIVNI